MGRLTLSSLWQSHQLGGSCPGLAYTVHLPAHHRQRQARLAVEARCKPAGMGVWATKAGMTQIFTPEGLALPATVLAMEEGNIVTQVLIAHQILLCSLNMQMRIPPHYNNRRLSIRGWVGQSRFPLDPAGEDRGHGWLQRSAGGLPGVQGEAHHKAGAQALGKVWRASHAEAEGVPGEELVHIQHQKGCLCNVSPQQMFLTQLV